MARPQFVSIYARAAGRGRAWLAAAFALLCGAAAADDAPVHTFKLRNPAMAANADGRMLVKYLVSCALPAGTVVEVASEGGTHRFPGSMGLAPAWAERDLNEAEQRLVSGCILARTNRYGLPVLLSMRNPHPDAPPALHADETERREHPLYEGAFFGNLFQPGSPAYVCLGEPRGAEEVRALENSLRVCSLPAQGETPEGLTRCDFIAVGQCGPDIYVRDGIDYSAGAVHIYLKTPSPL